MLGQAALLMGLLLLGTSTYLDQFVKVDKNLKGFTMSVEYVVFNFNAAQEDPFAYKLLRVLRSRCQLATMTYLIELEMGRTVCKKEDEDLDNCPLQRDVGYRKVRCTYFVQTLEWITKFFIVNSTCAETSVARTWPAP